MNSSQFNAAMFGAPWVYRASDGMSVDVLMDAAIPAGLAIISDMTVVVLMDGAVQVAVSDDMEVDLLMDKAIPLILAEDMTVVVLVDTPVPMVTAPDMTIVVLIDVPEPIAYADDMEVDLLMDAGDAYAVLGNPVIITFQVLLPQIEFELLEAEDE